MNKYNMSALMAPSAEALPSHGEADQRGIDVRELLATLVLRLPTIAVTALLILTLATAGIWQWQKTYTGTALLEIDPSEAEMVGVSQENALAGTTLTSLIETHVEVLNSSRIALKVIEELKLWRDDEFAVTTGTGGGLLNLISFSRDDDASAAEASFDRLTDRQRAELVANLARRMNVARRGLTSVIAIGVKSISPEKAARIANTYANAYIDITIETRLRTAERAAAFLQSQLDLLAANIQKNDAAMTGFILGNSEKFGSAETQALLRTYRTAVTTLDAARTSRLATMSELRRLTESKDFSSAGQLDLGKQFQDSAARQSRLSLTLQGGDVSVREQLARTESELGTLAAKQLALAGQLVRRYDSEIAGVHKSIADLIGSQTIPADLSVGLYRLQKEAVNQQRLYETYAARLGDVERIVGLPISTSRLIAEAIAPAKANAPSRTLLFLVAAVLACGLGVVAGLLRHYYIGGFSSSAQLEAVGGHAVIANVIESDEDPNLVIIANPDSPYGESIRRVRIGLESTSASSEATSILVTSTDPGEGKTTIAICVARAFALSGRRSLLIDADLRRPSIATSFGMTKFDDLLDAIMSRQKDLDLSKYVFHEKESGLDILFTGERGGMASDLILASAKFARIVEHAKQKYDYVLFDSPPVGHVVDALVLQRLADKILYVVRSGSTNQRDVTAAVKQMGRQADAPPIHFILNRTKSMLTGYGYTARQYGYR